MRVNIRMNNSAIRTLTEAQIRAGEMTVEAVKTDVIAKNVIPFDSGSMQNEQTSIDTSRARQGHFTISTNAPQARRLYFHPEYNFRQDNNPNAKGRWYDDWISGKYKSLATNAYKRFYRQLTGV